MKNKETIEEVAERLQKDKYGIFISKDADVKGQLVIDTANAAFLSGMNEGYKLAQQQNKKLYNEEEVFNLLMEFSSRDINSSSGTPHSIAKWFEQFKKK